MIELKTMLIALHLVGVVLGLGAASVADLYIYKSTVAKSVSQIHVEVVRTMSSIVTFGLTLTLVSGAAFVIRYYHMQPDMLLNPKLHAKIFVVMLLTLNAVYIHRCVLPKYCATLQHNLISSLSLKNFLFFIGSATISITGWWWSFFLGVARELNFTYSANVFLCLYFTSAAAAFCVGMLVLVILRNKKVGSTHQCDGLGKRSGWYFVAKDFSRPGINL